jgi:hypothetical protein
VIYEVRQIYYRKDGVRIFTGTTKSYIYRTQKGVEKWWPIRLAAVKHTNKTCTSPYQYGCEATVNGKLIASYRPWDNIDRELYI